MPRLPGEVGKGLPYETARNDLGRSKKQQYLAGPLPYHKVASHGKGGSGVERGGDPCGRPVDSLSTTTQECQGDSIILPFLHGSGCNRIRYGLRLDVSGSDREK